MSTPPTVPFPAVEVRLLSGEMVEVKPWSLKLGRQMRDRITSLFERARETGQLQDFDVVQLVGQFETDIYHIVRDTIGKDDTWMEEHLAYEDQFTLAQAVVDVCIIRADGGGALGKLLGAVEGAFGGDRGLTPELAERLEQVRRDARGENETPTKPSPEASPSSQGGGAQLPIDSQKS